MSTITLPAPAAAAPAAAAPAATGDSGTYRGWFTQLLNELGIAPTPGAVAGLADVVHEEGANSYNNPFNIEYHAGQNPAWKGSGNFNSVGVQEYPTPAAGLAATAAFLQDNPRYGNLLNSLRSGNTATVQQALVNEYTWAPFHTATPAQEQAILSQTTGTAANVPTGQGGGQSTSPAASGVASGQTADFLGIGSDLKTIAFYAIGGLGGLALIVAGLAVAAKPAAAKAVHTAETVAPAAAAL